MTSVTIDVGSFLRFAENMGASGTKVRAALVVGGNAVAQQGAQIAQSILSSNGSVVTGDLRSDITAKPTSSSGDNIIIQYGPSMKQPANWVEHGRGPVSARAGGRLKFQIKGRGPVIYAKSVGPARPRPFMQPSVKRLMPIATKTLGEAAMRAVEGMV